METINLEILEEETINLELLEEESSPKQTPWLKRTFGPMNTGSIRGSIFTLAATALGAGYLAIPKVCEYSGVILGLLIISFCGFLKYLSLRTVSRACFVSKKNHYSTATEILLGKGPAMVLEVAIISHAFGLIITLNIVIGDIVPSIFRSLGSDLSDEMLRVIFIVLLNLCVVTPLGLRRKLGALRFKALFNIISLSYLILLILVEFPLYNKDFSKISYFKVDINIFSAFSLGLFAYLCHQNLAKMQAELANSNERRMKKVTFRAILLMDGLFTILSLFGYLSLIGDMPSLIVMRDPPAKISNDWAMVLGKALVSLVATIAIPINLSPCRASLEKVVFKVEESSPLWMHVAITISIIFACLTIAILYPNIKFMINFLGGFCASFMALIIPSLLHVKMSGTNFYHIKNLAVLIAAFILSILAFASFAIDLMDQVQKFR